MGYGGEVKNSGVVTKLSNDGGIDGIIKEDILGFNHISIQAKRYALDNNVQRHEVQSFVGAVAGTPSKKVYSSPPLIILKVRWNMWKALTVHQLLS